MNYGEDVTVLIPNTLVIMMQKRRVSEQEKLGLKSQFWKEKKLVAMYDDGC